jgi:hypothetical protein
MHNFTSPFLFMCWRFNFNYNNYVNKDFITNLFNIRIFTLLERDICIICHNKKSVVKLFGHCTKTL